MTPPTTTFTNAYDAAGNRVESHLSSGYSYGYQTGSGGRTFLRMPQT